MSGLFESRDCFLLVHEVVSRNDVEVLARGVRHAPKGGRECPIEGPRGASSGFGEVRKGMLGVERGSAYPQRLNPQDEC